MIQFESKVKIIPYSQTRVYDKVSDLSSLGSIAGKIPQDKVSDFEFDADNVRFSMSPIGKIALRIVDREPEKCVKFESVDAPLAFNLPRVSDMPGSRAVRCGIPAAYTLSTQDIISSKSGFEKRRI